MVLQLKTIAVFFKSMVEFIKTITCFLFIYGLNQNHCLLANSLLALKYGLPSKPLNASVKQFIIIH